MKQEEDAILNYVPRLVARTKLPYPVFVMKADNLIKLIRRTGRKHGVAVRYEPSHSRLYYGDRFTTVKGGSKDVGPGLLAAMLRQLGLTMNDLES